MVSSESHTASGTPGTEPWASQGERCDRLCFCLPGVFLVSRTTSDSLSNSPHSQVAYAVQKRASPALNAPCGGRGIAASSQAALAITPHCHLVSLLARFLRGAVTAGPNPALSPQALQTWLPGFRFFNSALVCSVSDGQRVIPWQGGWISFSYT